MLGLFTLFRRKSEEELAHERFVAKIIDKTCRNEIKWEKEDGLNIYFSKYNNENMYFKYSSMRSMCKIDFYDTNDKYIYSITPKNKDSKKLRKLLLKLFFFLKERHSK